MGNLNMEATQIHYRHDNTMTVDKKLQNLEGRVATLEDGEPAEVSKVDIAPVFSAETAYSAGDYVYHEGHLYKFTADHAAGTWSDLDTESAVVTSDLAELQSDLTAKQDATDNSLQTTDKTIVGGINELMSGLTDLFAAQQILPWGNYGDTTPTEYTTNNNFVLGRLCKIECGANGRFIGYFTPTSFGNDTVYVLPFDGTNYVRITFTANNKLNIYVTDTTKVVRSVKQYLNISI